MTETQEQMQQRLEEEKYQQDLTVWVQKRLKQLNYVNGGEIDGFTDKKTEAEILNFRNRNGLPLSSEIDDQLVEALRHGSPIELPYVQVTATAQDVAPKVAAVNETLWAKFWAKVLGIPSLITTLVLGIVDYFDEAVTMLQPIRGFVESQLTSLDPLWVVIGTTSTTTVIAGLLWYNSGRAESALVEGYQQGTVKNDNLESIG